MDYLDVFNNREKATAIWLAVFAILALRKSDVRESLLGVVKAVAQRKVVAVLTAMVLYVALVVLVLREIGLWDMRLVKDTIYWMVGVALFHLIKVNEQDGLDRLKKDISDSVKLAAVLEFIVDLYSFSLPVELALVPFASLLVVLSAFAGTSEEYRPMKRLTDALLAILGCCVIAAAVARALGDLPVLIASASARGFAIPLLLTVAYAPFLYGFHLVAAYELLFLRFRFRLEDSPGLARYAKIRALALCHVNLGRLYRFSRYAAREFGGLKDRDAVSDVIGRFAG